MNNEEFIKNLLGPAADEELCQNWLNYLDWMNDRHKHTEPEEV